MFKKALAHQSNATPIRSSARRQLVSSIMEQHPLLTGDDSIDQKELAKVILPEGVRMATFETSGGVEGTMYFDQESEPLWMSFGRSSKEYIPTLSLLSISPCPPLPILQIHHPIPPPLLTGAPLFVPALRNLSRLWLIPDVPEGGIVAFAISQDNGSQVEYIGVGRVVAKGGVRGAVERRIQKLRNDEDTDEGKFCDILCIRDDHLWDMGSKPRSPIFTLPTPSKALAQPPPPVEAPSVLDLPSDGMGNLSVKDTTPIKTPSLQAKDVSTLLQLALLQTLSPESSSLSFPIPASQLYSGYILPNRPAYIPKDQREEVVIAKSEWKKLAKWMKEASKDGLIKIKDNKGEVTVQSCDVHHPAIAGHSGYLTISEEEAKLAKKAAREAASNGESNTGSRAKGKELVIEELWKPHGTAVSFWESAGIDKSSLNPSASIKSVFEGHISKHALVNTQDYRTVTLDEELGRAIGVRNPVGERMAREEVLKRLRASAAWSVSIDGVLKKGQLQPITMSVKTRQGRKTVTIITGLETFGVDVEDFAEELRKLCAGSASIQPLSGSSQKSNLKEIMVQGPQIKIVTEALIAKGIPKRWIKEVDGGRKR